MKGYASRFYQDTPQPCFRERDLPSGPTPSVPHWEICRPDVRPSLQSNDMVFFYAPGRFRGEQRSAVCYGVLVVGSRLAETDASRILGKVWLVWHRRQRCQHHSSKGEHDGKTRKNDIVLGNPERSRWLAGGGLDLREFDGGSLLRGKKIGLRRNFWLTEEECNAICEVLSKESDAASQ